jgi:hypothetical protein
MQKLHKIIFSSVGIEGGGGQQYPKQKIEAMKLSMTFRKHKILGEKLGNKYPSA